MKQEDIISKLKEARSLVKEVLNNYYEEIDVCIDCECSDSTIRPYLDKRNMCWDIMDNINKLINNIEGKV